MRYTKKRKDLTPRQRRHRSIRNKIVGTQECPRLHVLITLRYVYAQVIDDAAGVVLASANSSSKSFPLDSCGNVAAAVYVGKSIGEAATAAGFGKVVFDRAGSQYHGKVKALAEAAREAGLKF